MVTLIIKRNLGDKQCRMLDCMVFKYLCVKSIFGGPPFYVHAIDRFPLIILHEHFLFDTG